MGRTALALWFGPGAAPAPLYLPVLLVEHCDPELESFTEAEIEAGYTRLKGQWHQTKDSLLQAGADRKLPINRLNAASEGLRSYLRIVEQLKKAAVRQRTLTTLSG